MRRAGLLLLAGSALLALGQAGAWAAGPSSAAMPAEIASRFFYTSQGVRLHTLQAGVAPRAATRDMVVFVPGWSMPASIWRKQLVALGRQGPVVAIDPRGQGLSDIPAGGYHIDRRADDLHELLAQYERVILVGWSLGALEALQYIHQHGEKRLAALVLVDSSVGEGEATAPSKFPEELRRNRGGAIADFIKAIFKTPQSAPEMRALIDSAMRMPLESSLALFPSHLPREHWRKLARGFGKPLLYVVTPQFARQAQILAQHRPKTQVEVFEKAGHALFVDEAERFNALLDGFIAAVVQF